MHTSAHRIGPKRAYCSRRTAIDGRPPIVSLLMPNLRRGHFENATEALRQLRVAAAFTELAKAI